MLELVVNLDHLAVLRERRGSNEPDPVAAAVIAELAGAGGVAVHLRADRRFVQERDVRILREIVKTTFHLALPPTNDSVKLAYAVKPDSVTLVPERREEVSSSIGLDAMLNQKQLKTLIRALKEVGVAVSILVDPDVDQVKAGQATDADGVMINTRLYGDAARRREARDELQRIENAAQVGDKLGLHVAVGHGLDYRNISPLAANRYIHRIEVGHAILARAVFVGLDSAVREMTTLLRDAR